MTTVEAQVRSFFTHGRRASLKLPSGWFGRPEDNLHELTGIRLVDTVVEIDLDHRHRLTLHGPVRVTEHEHVLRLSGFTSATWESRGWGSRADTTTRSFDAGVIELHRSPETRTEDSDVL